MRETQYNGYTIEKTQDEFGTNRFFVTSPAGDWVGEAYDTWDLAVEAAKDMEPYGAGSDPYGRPDPQTHPEFWTE